MRSPTRSYLKVPYDLRPAKQVERRMMVDGLRILSTVGFAVSDYRYVGLGSVHFVDFVMFHKLLGIRRLTSVEHDEGIQKRVKFNRPYKCVKVQVGPLSTVIPTLDKSEKHILWMDYDEVVNQEQLEEIWQAAATLGVGSVLIVTVDAEEPGIVDANGRRRQGTPKGWKAYYENVAGIYLGERPVRAYSRDGLTRVNIDILSGAIASGVASRQDAEVIPVFSFLYADGHRMLTLGCVIGTEEDAQRIRESPLTEQVYFRDNFRAAPYEIVVPIVTRKERGYLDKAMPCREGWVPKDFEMGSEDVARYREVYRFLPAYAELLL